MRGEDTGDNRHQRWVAMWKVEKWLVGGMKLMWRHGDENIVGLA